MPQPFPDIPPVPRPLPAPSADEPPRLTARTLEGLEWVLARELEAVGARDLRIGRRTIEFAAAEGRQRETLYRAVLECRTAIRVLEPLGRFRVDSPESLHRAMMEVDWTEQLKTSDTLRVDAVIHDTFLTHSLYAAQIVKDAVVDQLRTPSGKRPGVALRGATLRLALHLVGGVATIFRDAAGRSLHQRGWRMGEVEAPLSEVLAAGILAIAGWWRAGAAAVAPRDGATTGEPLLDPMCGSGTLVIEAAAIAAGIAPGLHRARRRAHGFSRFRDCDRGLVDRLVAELESRVCEPTAGFAASDLDPRAVEAAKACAVAAGVERFVAIEQRHFEEVRPAAAEGIVVTNPPYGERLPLPRAGALFRRLGDWLVGRCGGWRAAILAADTPAAGQLGLRPTHRVPLMNGPIACRLLEVEIRKREPPPPSGQDSARAPAASSSAAAPPPGGPEEGARAPATGSGRVRARPIEDQIGDFRRRLAKRFKHLSRWARRQEIEAFRVYDRDIPEIPLVIDWYAGWLHAAEYERPHERTEIEHDVWLDKMVEAAAAELGVPIARTFLKMRKRQRAGGQYEKLDQRQALLTVREGGLSFQVNLSDYLDTGLFLDHRQTRGLVRAEAAGRRMLNLFCYTGSFSVYAAAGGAAETVSVDLSNTYLEWTRTNLAANGFKDAGRHRTVRDESRAFLEHRANRGEPPFDLVVVDPPTFSRSAKSGTPWDVEQDHAGLLELVAANLAPGGIVYFSTNFRRFHLDEQRVAARYTLREITNRTIPEDFRNERIHRAWRMVLR
jgi:23S rRNA (guanine2445-N2)-methyltransferase / 23S rRNA (guanine2069-N7)-methyltransferase